MRGRRTRWAAVGAAFAVLLGGLACSRPSAPSKTARPNSQLDVEASTLVWSYFGCREVFEGPICEVPSQGTVTIWARSTTGTLVEPKLSGMTMTSSRTVDGGRQWRFSPTADRGEVTLTEVVGGARRVESLSIRRFDRPACPLEMPDFASLSDKALDAFEAQVREQPSDVRPDCWRRAISQARPVQRITTRNLRWTKWAHQSFRQAGRIRSAVNVVATRAFILFEGNRADESQTVIAPLASTSSITAGLRLPLLTTYAFASHDLAEFAAARRALQFVMTWAERLDAPSQWQWAGRALLIVLEHLGDGHGAERLAAKLALRVPNELQGCLVNGAFGAILWWSLAARTRPFRPLDEPIAASLPHVDLAEVRRRILSNLDDCKILRVDALTNLALESILLGRPQEADAYLRRAEADIETGPAALRSQPWLADARIEWALAEDRPAKALARTTALAQRDDLSPMLAWTLATKRAEAHRRMGKVGRAIAAWEEAVLLVNEWPGVVELDRSFGGLASSIHEAAQRHVDFLNQQNRVAEGLQTFRWARARALRAARRNDRLEALPLDRQRQWRSLVSGYQRLRAEIDALPEPDSMREVRMRERAVARLSDQARVKLQQARALLWSNYVEAKPRGPENGELFLAVYPGRNAWQLSLADVDGARSSTLVSLRAQRDALRTQLVAAFARYDDVIARSDRIRVMAVGDGDRIDIHKVSWRGRPLFHAKPVVYGLDLQRHRRPGPKKPSRALLVADPQTPQAGGALPLARVEAATSQDWLQAQGWRTTLLSGPAATRAATVKALEDVDLFHFAGHARADGTRLGPVLHLARGQHLAVSDVLALTAGPRIVILSACESGRDAARGVPGPDLGVAQAFLLSGTSMVVATTRPVTDGLGAKVGHALHRSSAYTPAEAARVLGQLDATIEEDVSAFRVFVP